MNGVEDRLGQGFASARPRGLDQAAQGAAAKEGARTSENG